MDNNMLENAPSSFLANLSSRLLHQSRVNQQYLSNSGPPSTLDLSEFPSLTGKSSNGSNLMQSQNAPGSSRPAYVGIIKENVPSTTTASEFTIHSEDFPALPGSNPNLTNTHETNQSSTPPTSGLSGLFNSVSVNQINQTNSNSLNNQSNLSSSLPNNQQQTTHQSSSANLQQQQLNSNNTLTQQSSVQSDLIVIGPSSNDNLNKQQQNISIKRNSIQSGGIQTSKDGRVTNIPQGMVTDQFGMVGLLAFIRAAESDPSLVSLALGTDLTTLKLDLNSTESLYSTFPGPWSDVVLRPHEIDYSVPQEYLINNQIRDKLASVKLSKYQDDMLFFLFYLFPQDYIQAAAAHELYTRDWRYHKDEKVWITRAPGKVPIEKTSTYERGTYYYFDVVNWQKVAKEFYLDYDRLENSPININLQTRLMNQQTS